MLKAGFKRVDITPPLNTYLAGYYQDRYAQGVLEPIELNALAVSDGTTTAVILITDLQGLKKAWADPIRRKIAKETGLDISCISVSALHQHTSYALRPGIANNAITDYPFLDVLDRKFCDAAKMAIDDMEECVLSTGEKETSEPIAFIRRYLLKDGTVRTNPHGYLDQVVSPAEEPDNTVRLIRFKRKEKNDIALVNFATHPDVVGGEMLSWDWCGYVRYYVERMIPDTHCLLMNGFEGDSNHCDFIGGIRRGHEHCKFMGKTIAEAVLNMWDNTKDHKTEKLSSKVELVYNKSNIDKIEYYDECLALRKEGDIAKKTPSGITYTEAGRIVSAVQSAPVFQKIPATVISFGDVTIVGLAGEAFVNYATDLRKKYPEKFILTSCSMNGHEGYLPTTTAFSQGGYEVEASPFSSTIEDDCMKVIDKLLN